MADQNLHQLMATVASMYYEKEMSQNAIAEALGLSRVKIYRLLKGAKEEQVVQILINWPMARDTHLEQLFKDRFNLSQALILVSNGDDQDALLHQLGQLTASYLERTLEDGMTMAVCLGRSTYEVIHAIRPGFRAKVNVAQAIGSIPFAMQDMDSGSLARQLAQKLGGDVFYLSAPMMANQPEDAEILRNQRDIERTLTRARASDVALVGIGNLDTVTSGFLKTGFIDGAELVRLKTAGAVGDMAGRIFNLTGQLHPCSYNQRVIGIDFDDLRTIPTTIAVAAGTKKAKAIVGGLRTGVIDVLCIDSETAHHVLAIDEELEP